jgi:deoxyhypusine synthase
VVDQDFFEGLGFNHYHGFIDADDNKLREQMIDRIYDTFIDEEDLRICDMTINEIADSLQSRPYSSREFINEMGKYLVKNKKDAKSFVMTSYEKNVPIFCPAFTDSSAGFGLVYHQAMKKNHISIDSIKDFKELTEIKIKSKDTGIIIVGGGVPKNFIQDTVVAADILGKDAPMHKYAIQLTVADEKDGALSGSTFKEASSWGKVDQDFEVMVFGEATITFPILANYAYHTNSWKDRKQKELNLLFHN